MKPLFVVLAIVLTIRLLNGAEGGMFEIRLVSDKPMPTSKAYSLPAGEGKPEQILVEPEILLDQSAVRFVGRGFGLDDSVPSIGLLLSKEGEKKFGQITKQYQGKRVAIFLDGQLQSAPQMEQLRGIRGDDTVVISGNFGNELLAKLNEIVSSGPLPVEFQPVQDFSQDKTGEALWKLVEQQREFEKHFHPGEARTSKEADAAFQRQYTIASELLKRFPDDSHKWEAKKIKSENRNTADRYEEGKRLVNELATAPDVPPDIKKWARYEWLSDFVIGRGQSGETEIADYCRDYPENVNGCENLKFDCAQWLVAFRKEPEKAQSILNDLAENGGDYHRREAKKLLQKQEELGTTEGRAKYSRQEVTLVEQGSGFLSLAGKPFTLKVKAIDGSEIDAAKLRGKVVLVDFWATWCGPCVQDIPNLIAAYKKYHEKGLEIIGVSLDASVEPLQKFVTTKGVTWPQCLRKQGVLDAFNPPGIPTAFLVDRKGNVVSLCKYPYAENDAEYQKLRDADIKKLLAE